MGAIVSQHTCGGKDKVKHIDLTGENSKNGAHGRDKTSEASIAENNGELQPPAPLTEEEIKLIEETWVIIERDAEQIGAVSFMNLFDAHPETKDSFVPFKSIEVNDKRYNRILRNHGLKVLNTVGKMVHRLHTYKKMTDMVCAVGKRHGDYKANASLIPQMCPHLIKAIENALGEKWTPDVEKAYQHIFVLLCFYMKTSLEKIQKETGQIP